MALTIPKNKKLDKKLQLVGKEKTKDVIKLTYSELMSTIYSLLGQDLDYKKLGSLILEYASASKASRKRRHGFSCIETAQLRFFHGCYYFANMQAEIAITIWANPFSRRTKTKKEVVVSKDTMKVLMWGFKLLISLTTEYKWSSNVIARLHLSEIKRKLQVLKINTFKESEREFIQNILTLIDKVYEDCPIEYKRSLQIALDDLQNGGQRAEINSVRNNDEVFTKIYELFKTRSASIELNDYLSKQLQDRDFFPRNEAVLISFFYGCYLFATNRQMQGLSRWIKEYNREKQNKLIIGQGMNLLTVLPFRFGWSDDMRNKLHITTIMTAIKNCTREPGFHRRDIVVVSKILDTATNAYKNATTNYKSALRAGNNDGLHFEGNCAEKVSPKVSTKRGRLETDPNRKNEAVFKKVYELFKSPSDAFKLHDYLGRLLHDNTSFSIQENTLLHFFEGCYFFSRSCPIQALSKWIFCYKRNKLAVLQGFSILPFLPHTFEWSHEIRNLLHLGNIMKCTERCIRERNFAADQTGILTELLRMATRRHERAREYYRYIREEIKKQVCSEMDDLTYHSEDEADKFLKISKKKLKKDAKMNLFLCSDFTVA